MLPHVELQAWSLGSHVLQIYTGLSLLHEQGKIRLTQRIIDPEIFPSPRVAHLRNARDVHTAVVVDGRHRLYFDLHDSQELNMEEAENCALYFKRSFAADTIPPGLEEKVRPLGLNYAVTTDRPTWLELKRSLALTKSRPGKARALALYATRCLFGSRMARRSVTVAGLERPPQKELEPRILFIARAWDPAEINRHDRAKIEERHQINVFRAECVRRLRREFGHRFTGGLERTPFAERSFPDLVVPSDMATTRRAYLKRLTAFPICIATMGLHGSNGWKLGEYVALSKAIVSERLRYLVPGTFQENANYLAFNDAEQCVEQAGRLMDQPRLRREMMDTNWHYYREFVRPDRLVGRALAQLHECAAAFRPLTAFDEAASSSDG